MALALRFRGSIAPASLKRGLRLALNAKHLGFRGSIAPASLKRVPPSAPKTNDRGFRGSIAPASLKRGRVFALEAGLGEVSGALLPRPH